jgi:hypothetical protein
MIALTFDGRPLPGVGELDGLGEDIDEPAQVVAFEF